MAMSMMLRSHNLLKASTLSHGLRYSSIVRSLPKNLTSKAVAQCVFPKVNAMVGQSGIRQISLTAAKQSAAGSNHAGLWTVERALSVALLGLLPAALACPSKTLDTLLAVSVVMHAHWGIEACVIDYVRPVLFGSLIPKVAPTLVIAFSAALLGGLLYFINTDIGIAQTVRKFWAIKGH